MHFLWVQLSGCSAGWYHEINHLICTFGMWEPWLKHTVFAMTGLIATYCSQLLVHIKTSHNSKKWFLIDVKFHDVLFLSDFEHTILLLSLYYSYHWYIPRTILSLVPHLTHLLATLLCQKSLMNLYYNCHLIWMGVHITIRHHNGTDSSGLKGIFL